MKTVFALKFKCHSNVDLNGVWKASETKSECAELGMTDDDDWMRYLFMNMFGSYEEWTDELESSFINNATIEAKYKLGDDVVTVTKTFN